MSLQEAEFSPQMLFCMRGTRPRMVTFDNAMFFSSSASRTPKYSSEDSACNAQMTLTCLPNRSLYIFSFEVIIS